VQVSTDEAPLEKAEAEAEAAANRTYELKVNLTVPALIEIEPKLIVWQLDGQPETRVVNVRMLHENPIHIKEVKSTRPNVEARWKAVREGWDYEITLTPKSVDKPALGMLTIVTDCPVAKHQRKMAFFSVQRDPSDGS
jgi:hypothetical protein